MKKALILHGWGANPEMHWFQEEKKILEGRGYKVSVPLLPHNHNPKESEWIKVIEDFSPDENSILIGHSLGGTTILEYLEQANIKVKLVVLVSSPVECKEKIGYGLKEVVTDVFLESCDFEKIYDWEKIKKASDNFVLIYKEKDFRVPFLEGKKIAKTLGGEFFVLSGNDHGDEIDLNIINNRI